MKQLAILPFIVLMLVGLSARADFVIDGNVYRTCM